MKLNKLKEGMEIKDRYGNIATVTLVGIPEGIEIEDERKRYFEIQTEKIKELRMLGLQIINAGYEIV